MSSRTRNSEKRREREAEAIAQEQENARLEARTMYQRIEEARDVHDLREILHEISDRVEALEPPTDCRPRGCGPCTCGNGCGDL